MDGGRASLPDIDVAPLLAGWGGPQSAADATARALVRAARDEGFFFVRNHGVSPELRAELEAVSREFFALPATEKARISMSRGGKAWRGWFPVGAELTSGLVDQKEGIYFGDERPGDPRPLHGSNQWPDSSVPRLQPVVTEWFQCMRALGAAIMRGIWKGLGLPEGPTEPLFADPTCLFRIFCYPPPDAAKWGAESLSVGEHTDYGFLTILAAGEPGLEVRAAEDNRWLSVPPRRDAFAVNLGDALECATGGLLRATSHRVRRSGVVTGSRLSFPFFFDPGFSAPMTDLTQHLPPGMQREAAERRARRPRRWDGEIFYSEANGVYGDYLVRKVSRVFPELATAELRGGSRL